MAAARELRALLANSATISALDGIYQRTIARILDELASGISKPGAARSISLLARLRELVHQIDPKKDGPLRDWIRENIGKASVLGSRAATRQLQEQLEAVASNQAAQWGAVNTTWTPVNQTTTSAMVAAMTATLSRAAQDTLQKLGLAVRRTQLKLTTDAAIREATVGGVIRGATGKEVSDDIARIILGKDNPETINRLKARGFGGDDIKLYQEIAQGQTIQVGGKNFKVRAYANLVGRTVMREAHKVQTVVRLQQNGVDHVQISRHVQLKKDECTPYAGNVYYIGPLAVDPAGFPSLKTILNGGPPFHPNCAHVLEPYVVELKSPDQVQKEFEQSNALPARFYGKSAKDVRAMVAELDRKDLQEVAPAGAADLFKSLDKGAA